MRAEDWREIKRDRNGFLADEMLEKMYLSLPVAVWDSKYDMIEFIDKHNWGDWLSDLEGKPYYTHYSPIGMNIGQQIKDIRKRKGMAQKDLACKLGISANAMCSIENGKAWPSEDTMARICVLLGVELKLIER